METEEKTKKKGENLMNIKILKPLTLRDDTTSELTSYCCGEIVSADTALGNQLISCGLAELFEGVIPAGTKNISANGEYEVSEFKTVSVNVGTLTVTYDVNGGTGTVQTQTLIAGNPINLDSGLTITPPPGLVFWGWATTDNADAPDVTSPYTPDGDVTLYAVWKETPPNSPEEA